MNAFVNKVKVTIYHIIKQLYRNKMLFLFLSDKSKVKIQVNLLTIILNANLEWTFPSLYSINNLFMSKYFICFNYLFIKSLLYGFELISQKILVKKKLYSFLKTGQLLTIMFATILDLLLILYNLSNKI